MTSHTYSELTGVMWSRNGSNGGKLPKEDNAPVFEVGGIYESVISPATHVNVKVAVAAVSILYLFFAFLFLGALLQSGLALFGVGNVSALVGVVGAVSAFGLAQVLKRARRELKESGKVR